MVTDTSKASPSPYKCTGDFKTHHITNEAVLGVFLQTYLPEQLLLDDELERLRITLIADLAHEKSSLKALVE